MNILIINAHGNNRGDEAAISAMIYSLKQNKEFINANFTVHMIGDHDFGECLYEKVAYIRGVPAKSNLKDIFSGKGNKVSLFNKAIKSADIVIHAPGGPSLGETYGKSERKYFLTLFWAIIHNKPLYIYAPSMGPFTNMFKNIVRKFIFKRTLGITTRDPISKKYYEELGLSKKIVCTVDAAFQGVVYEDKQRKILQDYKELRLFLDSSKVVGITISDMTWHPVISKLVSPERIRLSYEILIKFLTSNGYKVLMIPQKFGTSTDEKYLNSYSSSVYDNNFMTMKDTYDANFQQFIIKKLYAIIGMRYHSCVFSSKVGTPLIAVAYEQKTKGLMETLELKDYCTNIEDLSAELLIDKFLYLEKYYVKVKQKIELNIESIRKLSKKNSDILINLWRKQQSRL